MKKTNTHILGFTLLAAFLMLLTPACKKDMPSAELELSYQMLSNKKWFLDYAQTIVGNNVTTRNYLGQSTYFVVFYANRTTIDSDGIKGTYTVTNTNGQLDIKVIGTTANNAAVEYNYKAESIGSSTLVLSYTSNNIITKLYYTAK
ncbi:MAG: hypothetical protein RLZ56_346 [Bacteroidota bacterium]|jgi:hypothetical protein